MRLTAVGLIRVVLAVVVSVAAPKLQRAAAVLTLELVGLTGGRGTWEGDTHNETPF